MKYPVVLNLLHRLNTNMPVTTTFPYTQYGGIWKLNSASAAKGAGTWPSPPVPKLYSWGANSVGQLGLGNTTYYSSPKQVGALTDWLTVSGGKPVGSFTIALKTDGTFWSWGANGQGQLGTGNTTNYSSPKQIGALTNWLKISAGEDHTLAIKTDGTLWSWGRNVNGQLGLGNRTSYSSPKQVGSLTNWSMISGGRDYSAAIKTDGTLWTWGSNGFGRLGLGNITYYSSPHQIGSLTNWAFVYAGGASSFAITTTGQLYAWGVGQFSGQLGLGNRTNYSSPKQVGVLTNWLTIASGYYNTVAVKTDGTLWTWGRGTNGELALGNTTSYSSPKQVGSLTNWLRVNSSYQFCTAIKTDGTAWAWGQGSSGQLGQGSTTSISSPVQIGSLTTWTDITQSGYAVNGIAVN